MTHLSCTGILSSTWNLSSALQIPTLEWEMRKAHKPWKAYIFHRAVVTPWIVKQEGVTIHDPNSCLPAFAYNTMHIPLA